MRTLRKILAKKWLWWLTRLFVDKNRLDARVVIAIRFIKEYLVENLPKAVITVKIDPNNISMVEIPSQFSNDLRYFHFFYATPKERKTTKEHRISLALSLKDAWVVDAEEWTEITKTYAECGTIMFADSISRELE